jgi:hypothetical protein
MTIFIRHFAALTLLATMCLCSREDGAQPMAEELLPFPGSLLEVDHHEPSVASIDLTRKFSWNRCSRRPLCVAMPANLPQLRERDTRMSAHGCAIDDTTKRATSRAFATEMQDPLVSARLTVVSRRILLA